MDLTFDVDPSEFHERKRRRISSMNNVASGPKPAPTSAPGVHDIATFLPGRLEFEHELDNEAEDLVKDLEFGVCMDYGGEQLVHDENDVDVRARQKLEEEKLRDKGREGSTDTMDIVPIVNGYEGLNGHAGPKPEKSKKEEGQDGSMDADPNAEEPTLPPPFETRDSIELKLTLLEMYGQRVEKRIENKAIMFDRGLLEYKKVRAVFKANCLTLITTVDARSGEETAKGGKGDCTSSPTSCKTSNCG